MVNILSRSGVPAVLLHAARHHVSERRDAGVGGGRSARVGVTGQQRGESVQVTERAGVSVQFDVSSSASLVAGSIAAVRVWRDDTGGQAVHGEHPDVVLVKGEPSVRGAGVAGIRDRSLGALVRGTGVGCVELDGRKFRGAIDDAEAVRVGVAHGVSGVGLGWRFAIELRPWSMEVVRGGVSGTHGDLHADLDSGAEDRDTAEASNGFEVLA